jgi:tRNA dimethylallyltransferase
MNKKMFFCAGMSKTLIIISGPTGIGKSNLAMELASVYKTSIVSADSRQLFKQVDIGTAKPTIQDQTKIKHYFIDHIPVNGTYNVDNMLMKQAWLLTKNLNLNSMLFYVVEPDFYIKALIEGIDYFPEVDPSIDHEINAIFNDKGILALQTELFRIDPVYYEQVDLMNSRRLIRAIGVSRSLGKPYSSLLTNPKKSSTYNIAYVSLTMERTELYNRINSRTENMLEQGLLSETKSLIEYRNCQALDTVGYKEMFQFMDGQLSYDLAVDKIKQHTRNYAKRQVTWFNKFMQNLILR